MSTVLGFRLPLRKCRQNKLQLTLLPGLALLGCILTFPYFRDGNRNPSTVHLLVMTAPLRRYRSQVLYHRSGKVAPIAGVLGQRARQMCD